MLGISVCLSGRNVSDGILQFWPYLAYFHAVFHCFSFDAETMAISGHLAPSFAASTSRASTN